MASYPAAKHEMDRYNQAFHDCMDRYVRNEYTLKKDVCAKVDEREQCSEAIRFSCIQAETENRQTPEECARRKWVQESEVVALYYRVAGSTWSLLPLIVAVSVSGMYFLVKYQTVDNQNRRMADTFKDMMRPQERFLRDNEHFYLDQRHY